MHMASEYKEYVPHHCSWRPLDPESEHPAYELGLEPTDGRVAKPS